MTVQAQLQRLCATGLAQDPEGKGTRQQHRKGPACPPRELSSPRRSALRPLPAPRWPLGRRRAHADAAMPQHRRKARKACQFAQPRNLRKPSSVWRARVERKSTLPNSSARGPFRRRRFVPRRLKQLQDCSGWGRRISPTFPSGATWPWGSGG